MTTRETGSAGNLIDRARERIERTGWRQGALGDVHGDGSVDVVGALLFAAGGKKVDWAVYQAIIDETGFLSIPTWNNDPSTSLEDVILALKGASARYGDDSS